MNQQKVYVIRLQILQRIFQFSSYAFGLQVIFQGRTLFIGMDAAFRAQESLLPPAL